MSTLDKLINDLALGLAELSVAEAEREEFREKENEAASRLCDARIRVMDVQAKIHAAATKAAELVSKHDAKEVQEPEGDEITPDALMALGFDNQSSRFDFFISRRGRAIGVQLGIEDPYVRVSNASNIFNLTPDVFMRGVRTLTDLKLLFKLLTGEELGEEKL